MPVEERTVSATEDAPPRTLSDGSPTRTRGGSSTHFPVIRLSLLPCKPRVGVFDPFSRDSADFTSNMSRVGVFDPFSRDSADFASNIPRVGRCERLPPPAQPEDIFGGTNLTVIQNGVVLYQPSAPAE